MRAAILMVLLTATTLSAVSWTDGWKIEAEESRAETYLGREAIMIRNGALWLDSAKIEDGVVEFDVAAPAEQGFHGLIFRAIDHDNFENVYLRPHLSGRSDATQYQPVYNGVAAWQIYSGPRYALPVEIVPERWVHVRAAFRDSRLELTVDGQTLVFPGLARPLSAGAVALMSSGAPARFASVVVKNEAPPSAVTEAGAAPSETPPGTVPRWRVSSPFPESRLDSPSDLDPKDWNAFRWTTLEPVVGGIANLAMASPRTAEENTVFAAATLRARRAGPVRLKFGFSDRIVVYLNGRPIFRGNDRYRSRDYRFLGTVGLYDEVILPLREGDNELWMAVSEDFGGWAVSAQLVDPGSADFVSR